MSHKLSLLGAAASIALLASASGSASASIHNGWYVGLEGGADWVQNMNLDVSSRDIGGTPDSTFEMKLGTDVGWAAVITAGYGFGDHWRAELEGSYRHNNFSKATYAGPIVTSPGGDLSEWTIMGNVLYDFLLTDRFSLSLGVGAGVDDSRFHFIPPPALFSSVHVDNSDWRFAYQGIVGLNYAIGQQSELTLTYRYLRVQKPQWNGSVAEFLETDNLRFSNDEDLTKHTVTIGLRYHLQPAAEPYEPAPQALPAAPPAAPSQAQSFMIFFGFNKCNITPEADNVLAQAASAVHSMGSAAIQIVGHTDTKGTSKYNQKLSVCRANAAKSNLVAKGVAAGSIATSGKGETELLVQTADNVKEPQNRRATVDLQ